MNRFEQREQHAKDSDYWTLVPILLIGLFAFGMASYSLPSLRPYFWYIIGSELLFIFYLAGIFWTRKWRARRELATTSLFEIDRMTGTQFELFLQTYYQQEGYKATQFGGSGDGGADLILEKHGKRIVVQAKRYSKTVPFSAVQQAFTAKALYKCDEAWVVCNRHVSRQGWEASKELGVRIIGRKMLSDMLDKYKQR